MADHATADFTAYLDRNRSASPQKGEPPKKKESDPDSGTTLIIDAPRPRDEHSY